MKKLILLLLFCGLLEATVPSGFVAHYTMDDVDGNNTSDYNNITRSYATVVDVCTPSGGDYNDIQAAIDYAVTLTPSASNIIKISIHDGNYSPATGVRCSSYVDLIGASGNRSEANIAPLAGINGTTNRAALGLADNCFIKNLSIRANYSTGCGISSSDLATAAAYPVSNVYFENVYVYGIWDIAYLYPTVAIPVKNWQWRNCQLEGAFDGIRLNGENYFVDCIFDINNIGTTRDGDVSVIIPEGSSATTLTFIRCDLRSFNDRDNYGSFVMHGQSNDTVRFIDCNLAATSTGDGNAIAVKVSATSNYTISNCNLTVSGGLVSYTVNNGAGGTVTICNGTIYDSNLVNGSVTETASVPMAISNDYIYDNVQSATYATGAMTFTDANGYLSLTSRTSGRAGNYLSYGILGSGKTSWYLNVSDFDILLMKGSSITTKTLADAIDLIDVNETATSIVNTIIIGDGNVVVSTFPVRYFTGGYEYSNPATMYSTNWSGFALPYVTGKVGNALSFNGNDYIDTNQTFTDDFNKPFTISCWVKPDDGQPASIHYFLLSPTTQDDQFVVGLQTTGKIIANYTIGGEGTSCESPVIFSDGAGNDWKMVTVTVNESPSGVITLYLYIDGILQPNSSMLSANMSDFSSSNFYIGAYPPETWAGSIDDVIIDDRVWTAREVKAYYRYLSGLDSNDFDNKPIGFGSFVGSD